MGRWFGKEKVDDWREIKRKWDGIIGDMNFMKDLLRIVLNWIVMAWLWFCCGMNWWIDLIVWWNGMVVIEYFDEMVFGLIVELKCVWFMVELRCLFDCKFVDWIVEMEWLLDCLYMFGLVMS